MQKNKIEWNRIAILHIKYNNIFSCPFKTILDQEVQRLKIGMESLLVANEEKVR